MSNLKEYDLSNIKSFNDTFDFKKLDQKEIIKIVGDIKDQVKYSEKGNNIVITAYATQKVTYRKVETIISNEKISSGKNKNKYACKTIIYNAKYNENGDVIGYEEGSEKITYVKKKGSGETVTTYQTINSKNSVIATTDEDVTGQNNVIVNTSKVLGKITYKNGQTSENELELDTENCGTHSLFSALYSPVKSKNKYTGTWLTEKIASTKANETFALGANREGYDADIINYNMSIADGHGKDTVNLVKGANIKIELENDEDIIKTFSKNKNNIIMKLGKSPDYNSSEYTKKETIIQKSGKKYLITFKSYEWDDNLNYNEETEEYEGGWKENPSWEPYTYTEKEFKEIQSSMKHDGINLTVGTNTYYMDSEYHIYAGASKSLAQITFKNYLKLAENGVKIGDTSLKELLEKAPGVGYLGNSDSSKKQTLSGTFLNEHLTGGKNKDKINTGTGYDIVDAGEGNYTITLNSGNKELYFSAGDGNDTIKNANKADKILIDLGENVYDYWFTKSGNNLVIKRMYENSVKEENITVTDYFKNYNTDIDLKFADSESNVYLIENLTNAFKLGEINPDGQAIEFDYSDSKAKSIQGTALSDYIIAGNKTTKINAGEGNNEIEFSPSGKSVTVTSGTGNDSYYISKMTVSNDINDKGGSDIIKFLTPYTFADDYELGEEPVFELIQMILHSFLMFWQQVKMQLLKMIYLQCILYSKVITETKILPQQLKNQV